MQTAVEALAHSLKLLSINEKPQKPITRRDAMILDEGNTELHSSTSHIYLQYNVHSPPPKPNGPGWTRFICLSDTHGSIVGNVPDGDVLVHSGDLSLYGTALNVTVDWIKSLPHPNKIIIAGNHDDLLDTEMYKENRMRVYADLKDVEASKRMLTGRSAKDAHIQYLEYEARNVIANGNLWKTFGSPGTPWFSAGAFQYHGRREARRVNNLIPHDTQILITHGPPRNILDATRRGKHAGCNALSSRLFAQPPSMPNNWRFSGKEMMWDFLEEDNNNNNNANSHERNTSTTQSSSSAANILHHPSFVSTPPGNTPTSPSEQITPASSNNNNNNNNNTSISNLGSTHWLPYVRLHVFGHIHEARGAMIIHRTPPPSSSSSSSSPTTTSPHKHRHRHSRQDSNQQQQQQQQFDPMTITNKDEQNHRRHHHHHHHHHHRKIEEPKKIPSLVPKPIETVFVNAAGRNQPIIVDLWTPSS